MEWKLNDSRPIWMQLQEQLEKRILSGTYPPGGRMPSVRELAAQAGVNPNTMQRALSSLDETGLTVTNRTTGRMVTEDEGILEATRAELSKSMIEQFFRSAAELGYTKERALELLKRSVDV